MSKGAPTTTERESGWSASRIADLIQAEAARLSDGAVRCAPPAFEESRAPKQFQQPLEKPCSLDQLAWPDHHEFVDNAYRVLLGRSPTAAEHDEMLAALLRGDAKTWLLGKLRYGAEGRARGVFVEGLRDRYLAQKLFRIRGFGPLIEWLSAVSRLPGSLRYFRAITQTAAGARLDARESAGAMAADQSRDLGAIREAMTADAEEHARNIQAVREATDGHVDALTGTFDAHRKATDATASDLARKIDTIRETTETAVKELTRNTGVIREAIEANRDALARLERQYAALSGDVELLKKEQVVVRTREEASRARLDAVSRPQLADTLEEQGRPLVKLARERAEIPADVSTSSLTAQARYALFETMFYESAVVAVKQRVYLQYLDRELAQRFPFLDLGCGRGEFLQILQGEGVGTVGVDVNPSSFAHLRSGGFEVVEQDLVHFLETDRRTYCGASALQVAEHLTSEQIDRMLALVAVRLAPGALLILETPNPLSPFALGLFHTDPTHIAPLPPERLRFSVEAAGFERSRTLYQARIPENQFAGPDPRAYYADYAIIAYRSHS